MKTSILPTTIRRLAFVIAILACDNCPALQQPNNARLPQVGEFIYTEQEIAAIRQQHPENPVLAKRDWKLSTGEIIKGRLVVSKYYIVAMRLARDGVNVNGMLLSKQAVAEVLDWQDAERRLLRNGNAGIYYSYSVIEVIDDTGKIKAIPTIALPEDIRTSLAATTAQLEQSRKDRAQRQSAEKMLQELRQEMQKIKSSILFSKQRIVEYKQKLATLKSGLRFGDNFSLERKQRQIASTESSITSEEASIVRKEHEAARLEERILELEAKIVK